MAMRKRSSGVLLDLTNDDVDQLAEDEAQKYLGISRAEFVDRVKRGRHPTAPDRWAPLALDSCPSFERARNSHAAIERHKGVIQRSLSCVCSDVWQASESYLVLNNGRTPIQLRRSGMGPIYFSATQQFHTAKGTGPRWRDWKVYTDGYAYTVSEDPDLSHELISWHWHPTTRLDTHIHVGKQHPTHSGLAEYHIPSGRVSLEQVIRFLIADLGVTPQRPNWDGVLSDSHRRFIEYRRWADPSAVPPETGA